jgi:hypothetical protein
MNHYYVYCVDRDFGPCFIRVCSYFPPQRQNVSERKRMGQCKTSMAGIGFDPLDDGFASC